MITPTSFVTSALIYGRVATSWIVQKIVSSTIVSPYLRDLTRPPEGPPSSVTESHPIDSSVFDLGDHIEPSVEPSPPRYEPDPASLPSRREVDDLFIILRDQDELIGGFRHVLGVFEVTRSKMKKEIKRLRALNSSLEAQLQRPRSPRADHADVAHSGIEGAELPVPPRPLPRTRPPLTRAT